MIADSHDDRKHSEAVLCWICNEVATTGEHLVKASDLRALFGVPSQAEPLYYHSSAVKNRKVGSLKSDVLKSKARICNYCNSGRTQPHDKAWQQLSATLRERRPRIAAGDVVRANRVFTYDTRRQMLNVHLYFLKVFGCRIVVDNIPIDVTVFAESILYGGAHPNIYLSFGPTPDEDAMSMAGMSDVQGDTLDGKCVFATWFYHVGNLSVNVMYAIEGQERYGMVGAWHPRLGTNRLVMAAFMPNDK